MVDTAGNFQGKYHYTITDGLTAKLQTMVTLNLCEIIFIPSGF